MNLSLYAFIIHDSWFLYVSIIIWINIILCVIVHNGWNHQLMLYVPFKFFTRHKRLFMETII